MFGFGGYGRALTSDVFSYAKLREFRTRFKTGPSNWNTATTRNQMFIFGGLESNGAANAVDETQITTGMFFLCAPANDLDGDATADDGAEDAEWMFVVSNDTDGTFDFNYTSPDADVTWFDTGIDCVGSGRNSIIYELDITFDGTSVGAYLDDNDDTSTWTWTATDSNCTAGSGCLTADLPTSGFAGAYGFYTVGVGTPAALPIGLDWFYYRGVR